MQTYNLRVSMDNHVMIKHSVRKAVVSSAMDQGIKGYKFWW